MNNVRKMTVSEFITGKGMNGDVEGSGAYGGYGGYRGYWIYSNSNGKNAIDAREQLPEVVRKIIYAAYRLGIKEREEYKSDTLKGEVAKYHAHSTSSIEDSIKGVATAWKSQPATRVLEGIGNFGSAPGDEGAAGRYTSVGGTPLLTAMYQDLPFVPISTDDTGLEQPEYISAPLPMALINGYSPIGTGKSCYVAEREANAVIDWLDELRKNDWDELIAPPDPMSVTGCGTWIDPKNGYTYYQAVVYQSVDIGDVGKKGKWDVITNLPPKATPAFVIAKLRDKLPTRIAKQVIDGSGKGKPTWICVPHGYLKEQDYNKYGLRSARKESVLVWDHTESTMRHGSIHAVAKEWFEDRCAVVTLRLKAQCDKLQQQIHRVDLIREFAEHEMQNWKSEDVVKHFVGLNAETGEADASFVLGVPVRSFLPENLDKNEQARRQYVKNVKTLEDDLKHVGDVVIQEARNVIDAQERFFD